VPGVTARETGVVFDRGLVDTKRLGDVVNGVGGDLTTANEAAPLELNTSLEGLQ